MTPAKISTFELSGTTTQRPQALRWGWRGSMLSRSGIGRGAYDDQQYAIQRGGNSMRRGERRYILVSHRLAVFQCGRGRRGERAAPAATSGHACRESVYLPSGHDRET